MRERWALFVSGSGTTAQAALDCLATVDVRLIVSSRKKAFALARARRAGIPTLILDAQIDWEKLDRDLRSFRIERIFLLGFLKIIPEEFCQKWQGRMWNIHPSLLPHYKGLHAIEKSYEENRPMGVSIHEVTPGMDEGPIVYQKKVLQEPQRSSFQQAQLWMALAEQGLIRQFVLQNTLRQKVGHCEEKNPTRFSFWARTLACSPIKAIGNASCSDGCYRSAGGMDSRRGRGAIRILLFRSDFRIAS